MTKAGIVATDLSLSVVNAIAEAHCVVAFSQNDQDTWRRQWHKSESPVFLDGYIVDVPHFHLHAVITLTVAVP